MANPEPSIAHAQQPPQSEHSDAAPDWYSPATSAAECGECRIAKSTSRAAAWNVQLQQFNNNNYCDLVGLNVLKIWTLQFEKGRKLCNVGFIHLFAKFHVIRWPRISKHSNDRST